MADLGINVGDTMGTVGQTVQSSLGVVLNLTLRLIVLGVLIFLAVTYIPTTELSLEIRATIAVVTVLIYSLLDAIGASLSAIKNKLCEWLCGCSSGSAMASDIKL